MLINSILMGRLKHGHPLTQATTVEDEAFVRPARPEEHQKVHCAIVVVPAPGAASEDTITNVQALLKKLRQVSENEFNRIPYNPSLTFKKLHHHATMPDGYPVCCCADQD
jgi:hypothetical protein